MQGTFIFLKYFKILILCLKYAPWKGQDLSSCPPELLVSKCPLSVTASHQWAGTGSSLGRSDQPSLQRSGPVRAGTHQMSNLSLRQKLQHKQPKGWPEPKRRPPVESSKLSRPRPGPGQPAAAGACLSWLPGEQRVYSHWLCSESTSDRIRTKVKQTKQIHYLNKLHQFNELYYFNWKKSVFFKIQSKDWEPNVCWNVLQKLKRQR